MTVKRVTVIVPVGKDVSSLRLCLASLQAQTYDSEKIEIIVVGNGAATDLEAVKLDFPDVKWYYEPVPGSYSARNCGLRYATGEIIALTDADCIPAPTWLSNAVLILETSSATVIGGKIEFINPQDRDFNTYEIIEDAMFDMVNHRRVVETMHFAMTANLVTYRAVFERIGVFDSSLKSSGDREWGQRAHERGEDLKYAETVVIRHPRRSSFLPICKKLRRVVGGKIMLAKKRRKTMGTAPIFREIYVRSLLNVDLYKFAFFCPRVRGFWPRLKLIMSVLLLLTITTVEGVKVAVVGQAYRG